MLRAMTRRPRTTTIVATITGDHNGWLVRTEGRHMAAQYGFLAGVADYAVTKRWIDELVCERLKRELESPTAMG